MPDIVGHYFFVYNYDMNMNIILASASPRRKAILENAGYNLQVIPSEYDEDINGKIYTDILAQNCAYCKAMDVKAKIKDDRLVVSADTVVVADGIILGKPKDENEATLILKNLSNKTHFVATSISIISNDLVLNATEKTYVTFRELSETDIKEYILKFKPFDKAGSYGIQDDGFDFVQNIQGELDNVIGFPLRLFKQTISNF